MSSGTLRGWSSIARALECEKMTGELLAAIASRIVVVADVAEVDQHAEPVHLVDDGRGRKR